MCDDPENEGYDYDCADWYEDYLYDDYLNDDPYLYDDPYLAAEEEDDGDPDQDIWWDEHDLGY